MSSNENMMPYPVQKPAGNKLPAAAVSPPKAKSSSSSYPISSSLQSKKKSGTGLRILWIPGRKRHHDKGAYKPSNYNIEYNHSDRKTEPWNLGSSKSHDDIISGGDKDDKVDLIKSSSTPTSTATRCILPSASMGVATVNIDNCSETDSEIKLEKCVIKDIQYVVYNIRDSLQSLTSSTKENSVNATNGDGMDGKRTAGRNYTKNDYDSIERLDDLDGAPKLSSHQNGYQKKSTKTKEDKAVKCLYYTMMCCECTIS